MVLYITKRLLQMIPIILCVSFLIFVILSFTPGDPASMILSSSATQEEIDKLNHELGYDLPIMVRFYKYITNIVTKLDFGKSYANNLSVSKELMAKAPISIAVASTAMIISAVVGIIIGVLSAVKQYSVLDTVSTFIAVFLASVPAFVAGMLLLLIFSLWLHWFPTGGIGSFKHYVLPGVTLSLSFSAYNLRITRSSMLEVIRQDYIRTARAKGAKEGTVIWKHALRNGLLPVITFIGSNFSMQIGGALVTETLFNLPGLGSYIVNGIKQKDFPVVLGGILLLSVIYSFIILIVDLAYSFIDPRIKAKYSRRRIQA